jgi:hypothetical protein
LVLNVVVGRATDESVGEYTVPPHIHAETSQCFLEVPTTVPDELYPLPIFVLARRFGNNQNLLSALPGRFHLGGFAGLEKPAKPAFRSEGGGGLYYIQFCT